MMNLLALFGLAANPHRPRGLAGYATRPTRTHNRSKYVPHQGKRERERRRIGGFYTKHREFI